MSQWESVSGVPAFIMGLSGSNPSRKGGGSIFCLLFSGTIVTVGFQVPRQSGSGGGSRCKSKVTPGPADAFFTY